MSTKKTTRGIVAAFVLAFSLPVAAQSDDKPLGEDQGRPAIAEDQTLIHDVDDALAKEAPQISKKWIGVLCGGVDPALRAHIRLSEDVGLVVNEVIPNSPADEAGLQQHDILTEANGQPLGSTKELVNQVSAAGDGILQLKWIRKGDEMQGNVTPADRPADQLAGAGDAWQQFGGPNMDQLKKLWAKNGDNTFEFRMLGPQMPLRGMQMQLEKMPSNLSVQVTRNNDEPAKISVTRGDDTWEVTEGDMDQLPDDVRPFVENMVQGQGVGGQNIQAFELGGLRPNVAPQIREQLERLKNEMPWPRMSEEFDAIQKRMDKMFDELHQLKEMQPKQPVEDDDTIDA